MRAAHYNLSAKEAAAALLSGRLTSVALVQSCLDRIADTDKSIGAWEFLDSNHALAQAAKCDRILKLGLPTGMLHGIPVGLSDNIDTTDMPTRRGSTIFVDRQTDTDARLVELLRQTGAVIMGKTVTTELATACTNGARNPHNPDCSPGGSSGGSAAAVAALQVPLAIGTQTIDSIVQSASFCGTIGFKPTRGTISRDGILQTSVSLDQVGCFGRTFDDIALLTDGISGYDQRDPASFAHARSDLVRGTVSELLVPPRLAWFDLSIDDRSDYDDCASLKGLLGQLGCLVTWLPPAVKPSNLVAVLKCIHAYEIFQHQASIFDKHEGQLSDDLKLLVEQGREIGVRKYTNALAKKALAQDFMSRIFADYDAFIAPAASGEAPETASKKSGPYDGSIWSLTGLPCISLPILVGNTGLPIGVQLVGPAERDDRLLQIARWLQSHLTAGKGH